MLKEKCKKFNYSLFLKIFLSIISICAILFVFSFYVLKSKLSCEVLEKYLEDFSGLKVEFVYPKVAFDYKFNLNLSSQYINIYDIEKKQKYIEIKNPDISFKPIGLLFKRVYFKRFNIDSIAINIKRNPEGEVDILKSLKRKDWNFLKNKNILITRLNSNIKNIELNFEDKYKVDINTKIIADNSNINISKKNKILKISQKGIIITKILNSQSQKAEFFVDINSRYPIKNYNSKNLNLDIKIDNINLAIFNDLFRKYISNDIREVQGVSNINIKTENEGENQYQKIDVAINSPTLKLSDNKIINLYKDGVNINSLILPSKKSLLLKEFLISSNGLNIKADGQINNLLSKTPKPDLNIQIKDTQINNFLYLLPDNLIYYNLKGIPTLKKSNFYALLNGNLNIKSIFPVDITGSIKAYDIHIPNYPKPYRQNDVSATFKKDKMNIYTRIYTPDNEYVTINGVSNLDDSLSGKYSVSSTKKIDLSYAKLYLVPVQQIIGFNIGPVPIMDISGYGNINITTKGSIFDAQIFGDFEAYSASAEIEGLDAKLSEGKCHLVFDDRNLIFKEIKGKMDNADFLLTGVGNTKGEVKLNAKIKNAKAGMILKIFNNSIISKPYKNLTKDIAAASGDLEADINLKGTIKNYEDSNFLAELTPFGNLNLNNGKIILNNGIILNKLSGVLNFGDKQSGLFELFLDNSQINFEFASSESLKKISSGENFEIKSTIYSNSIQFRDVLSQIKQFKFKDKKIQNAISKIKDFNFYSKFYIKSEGKISINKPDLTNLKNKGYIIGLNSNKHPNLVFNSGLIKVENDKLIFNNFDISTLKGTIKANGDIKNFLNKKPSFNLNVALNNISLDILENILPKIKLTNTRIKNGVIQFKQDDVKLSSISVDYQTMPIFFNAQIKNIYDLKKLSLDYSTILDEKSSDNIINPYLTYPVKLKGEIPIKGSFIGTIDNYLINFIATIPIESDITFSGANLGDTNHKREIQGKFEVRDNFAKIHELKLIKYIKNQNNKTNPLVALSAAGQIVQKNSELYYNNFKIATNTPINVRILNLIFKKSLLKKGNFECNISLNGNIKAPKLTGSTLLEDLDIPLYDTQINNIKVNISDKFIDSEILAKNKQSDIKVFLKALNNLKAPYVINKLDIISNKLDILDILANLAPQEKKTDIELKEEILIKPSDVIIKEGTFDFKDVQYEKISAKNLKGKFDYNNNTFNLKESILDIAQGSITASGDYSLKSTVLNLKAKMKQCNSNILANDFLNANGQIYGLMDGELELKTKALNTPEGIRNTKSNIIFSVNNGKMPKLGSLEYLLRAGNLIKNGLLGLSLNNIIEVLTPYKTGEFEKIDGALSIEKGEVQKLEIKSQGKNLSLYLVGNYNILNNYADIKIYGKLSQKISNALGAIGNASIKQFIETITPKKDKQRNEQLQQNLDKIPSIEIETPEPRFFSAKVLGDINKDNYIKSFSWE